MLLILALLFSAVVYDNQGRISVVGSAEKKECMSTLSSLFDSKTSSSSSASCEEENDNSVKLIPLTFDCVHQPAFVTDSENFLVFENFYYLSSALGMDKATTTKTEEQSKEVKVSTNEDSKKAEEEKEKATRRNLEDGKFPLMTTPLGFKEAADKFCATNWNDAQSTYPKDEQPKDTVIKLCFGASFAFEFLTKGISTIDQYTLAKLSSHYTFSTHPINTPSQYTFSIHPCNTIHPIHRINTPSQYTLSTHSINTPYQHTYSIHPINTPSTHPINTPYQHTFSIHPINTPSTHPINTPSTHPPINTSN